MLTLLSFSIFESTSFLATTNWKKGQEYGRRWPVRAAAQCSDTSKFKDKSELCSEMKVLIQTNLKESDNAPCNFGYEQTPECEAKGMDDNKHLCSCSVTQPKKLRDAPLMLSSDTVFFLMILLKPNSHILESIQGHQNWHIGTTVDEIGEVRAQVMLLISLDGARLSTLAGWFDVHFRVFQT
jgi:hypothetical protein